MAFNRCLSSPIRMLSGSIKLSWNMLAFTFFKTSFPTVPNIGFKLSREKPP